MFDTPEEVRKGGKRVPHPVLRKWSEVRLFEEYRGRYLDPNRRRVLYEFILENKVNE